MMECFPNHVLLVFLQLVEGLLDTLHAPMLINIHAMSHIQQQLGLNKPEA